MAESYVVLDKPAGTSVCNQFHITNSKFINSCICAQYNCFCNYLCLMVPNPVVSEN